MQKYQMKKRKENSRENKERQSMEEELAKWAEGFIYSFKQWYKWLYILLIILGSVICLTAIYLTV